MSSSLIQKIVQTSFQGKVLPQGICRKVLDSPQIDLIDLLAAAFRIRKRYFGKEVLIHILNNAQNGLCPEDCRYCVQSKSAKANVETYPLKNDREILQEAKVAFESGAYRYCIVLSGRKVSGQVIERLAQVVRKVKSKFPLKTCLSAGFVEAKDLKILRQAGLDRLNHNLNTSEKFYKKICTTHEFANRVDMVKRAHDAGVSVCSGVIIGMGERLDDIIDVALDLKRLKIESIPINFLLPIPGVRLPQPKGLSAEFCLRVLCLFRFLNPKAEIRMAAGREKYLGALQPLGLYAANSLFLDGYLNAQGASRFETLRMIRDAGFSIKSKIPLDKLILREKRRPGISSSSVVLKSLKELRPSINHE